MPTYVLKRLVEIGLNQAIVQNHVSYDLEGNYLTIKTYQSPQEAQAYLEKILEKIQEAWREKRFKTINDLVFYVIWS